MPARAGAKGASSRGPPGASPSSVGCARSCAAASRTPTCSGSNPQTYELVTAPGLNTAATLRAETGKQVSIVADEEAGATEVRILIEGRTGLLRRAFD